MTFFEHSKTHGFTLAELAIVLVIVALLIGGLTVSLSTSRDIANEKETQKQLATPQHSNAYPARPHPQQPASRAQ